MGHQTNSHREATSSFIEPLESRTLLAGITIITHGFNDNTTGWVLNMANAITARAGGPSAVSKYTLRVGLDSHKKLAVLSFDPDAGTPAFGTASSGETVVKLDWSVVSQGIQSTIAVGDAVTSYLLSPHGNIPALVEQPIHLIGHSRGASLNTEIAKDLGQHDVWVDQFTSLDPKPITRIDEPMTTWSNIIFADDYWQSATYDISGRYVRGAFGQSLVASVDANPQGPPHQAVHAWYYGTIDLTATSDQNAVVSTWYGNSPQKPARDQTGFYFSSIVGGKRPVSGISSNFGGIAPRVEPGEKGTLWPDVGSVVVAGPTDVKAGQSLNVHFSREQHGGKAKAVVFLDRDRNPYNGNTVRVAARQTLAKTTGYVPARTARRAGTSDVAPGTYYVGVMITGVDGQTRYDYAPRPVTIS